MKKTIIFILSELLIYALVLGITVIVYPTIPLGVILVSTLVSYVFATILYSTGKFIIKLIVNNREVLDK